MLLLHNCFGSMIFLERGISAVVYNQFLKVIKVCLEFLFQ
ncbi:hypothetical protein EHF_0184 [Ehrlichia japonica]|uniref:Uncharacterized protein n=1 Tax=Ehrlichia japonica TaxID=391036 RepID=X5GJ49_9RICK|nr:hypothetical protein EHF_0184 [Ehrlichia japonica]